MEELLNEVNNLQKVIESFQKREFRDNEINSLHNEITEEMQNALLNISYKLKSVNNNIGIQKNSNIVTYLRQEVEFIKSFYISRFN